MRNQTTVLIIDDTKPLHLGWVRRKNDLGLSFEVLNLISAYSIPHGLQLLEKRALEIDIIAIDACVPGNRLNSEYLVRWLRADRYNGGARQRNVSRPPRFDEPIIGISDVPVYRELMKQAGCSHTCGRDQLIETIAMIIKQTSKLSNPEQIKKTSAKKPSAAARSHKNSS